MDVDMRTSVSLSSLFDGSSGSIGAFGGTSFSLFSDAANVTFLTGATGVEQTVLASILLGRARRLLLPVRSERLGGTDCKELPVALGLTAGFLIAAAAAAAFAEAVLVVRAASAGCAASDGRAEGRAVLLSVFEREFSRASVDSVSAFRFAPAAVFVF